MTLSIKAEYKNAIIKLNGSKIGRGSVNKNIALSDISTSLTLEILSDNGVNNNVYDILLFKSHEDIFAWDKKIDGNGYYNDGIHSIAIDSNDNVYAAGYGTYLVSSYSYEDWRIKKFFSLE